MSAILAQLLLKNVFLVAASSDIANYLLAYLHMGKTPTDSAVYNPTDDKQNVCLLQKRRSQGMI